MRLAEYVRLTRASEESLADAFALLLDRHGKSAELRHGAQMFLGWCGARLATLDEFEQRFPSKEVPLDPERLRSALFHDPRIGTYGLVRDLHDASLLAHEVLTCWICLGQSVEALGDGYLRGLADRRGAEVRRQLEWLETHIKVTAPQALTVDAVKRRQLEATVPFRKSVVALPDSFYGPLTGGLLVFLLGALALLAHIPWLVPSLGPSIYLAVVEAPHPSTRPQNVFLAHVVALAVGFALVYAFGAHDDPVTLVAHVLTWPRLFAAAIGLAFTIGIDLALRISHPPAGATLLLVALGSIASARDAFGLALGALLVAILSGALRMVRMGRTAHRRERRQRLGIEIPRLGARRT